MKKLLLGTTALAASGALLSPAARADESIRLTLGGYMNQYFGLGAHDSDRDTDYNATGLYSDGEVWFLGETTLDNGLTFGANVQLEAFGASRRGGNRDVIDEDFAYISGRFGRVNLGSENSAAYLMQYDAPRVGVPINSGWLSAFVPDDRANTGGGGFRTPRVSTNLDWNNDENVITYFTPRFAGFQIGATYAPTVSGSGDGANFPVQADRDTEFHNGLALGVNYQNSLGGFDLALAGGLRYAAAPDNTDGPARQLFGQNDDLWQYSAGLNVGFSGVTLGGSFGIEDSGRSTDGYAFDVGASYRRGPWALGATYFMSEVEGRIANPSGPGFVAAPGDDELKAVALGTSYAVGPGITASASILYVEWASGARPSLEADGVAGIVGLRYKF